MEGSWWRVPTGKFLVEGSWHTRVGGSASEQEDSWRPLQMKGREQTRPLTVLIMTHNWLDIS